MIEEQRQSEGLLRNASTIPQLIRGAAIAYGDSPAITRTEENGEVVISFSELDFRSSELAKGLIAQGVGKGSRIGLIYENHPQFAVVFAAITKAGAIAVPISTLIKANELVRVLRQSDLAGLIVQRMAFGKDMLERLLEALPDLRSSDSKNLRLPQVPFLRWIVSSGADLPSTIRGMAWLTESASTVNDKLLRQLDAEIHPSDQAMEIYTSGSMALPKGVRHNHGPLLARSRFILQKTPAAQRDARLVAQLPMFWIGGLMMYLFPNILVGATTVCVDRTLNNSRIAMGSVLADDDLEVVRPREGATIWALGMTETAGPYAYADRFREPGFPLCAPLDHIADGFQVRVVDENDYPVSDGKSGEIQLRGYGLTSGLHKVERAACFTEDGFYRTGDIGLCRGDRILFLGRNGDIIKTASANVSPAEVELEMQQLEGVHSAYVVGIPDKDRGQLVVAAVVPRDGAKLDFDVLQGLLRERLSSFKVPRAYVAIGRDEVPLLASNKVARREIELMIMKRLGREIQ
jgi:acyl-CoA synthetase (AMP-forming)/AMP-acid ligase II